MNKAYQTMRAFWLDTNNLLHKKEVPQLGDKKICVAGVEMAAVDDKKEIKNLLIVASSLGNASVYFENNSASGLGGFTGGSSSGPVREKALRLLQTASKTEQLEPVSSLPHQQDPEKISLFAIGADGQIYAVELKESDVRNPQNPFYAFFAYTQQLLGAFRAVQEQAAKQEQSPLQPTTQTPTVANQSKDLLVEQPVEDQKEEKTAVQENDSQEKTDA